MLSFRFVLTSSVGELELIFGSPVVKLTQTRSKGALEVLDNGWEAWCRGLIVGFMKL